MSEFDITQEVVAAQQSRSRDCTRVARWRILRILDVCGHIGTGDSLIHSVFERASSGPGPNVCPTPMDLRSMLQYLSDKGYIDVVKGDVEWHVRLLPPGKDFIDNPDARDEGILRGDV